MRSERGQAGSDRMSLKQVSAQDIAGQFDEVFSDVSEDGKAYFITEKGKARAVLVNVDRYHAWMDALENFCELDGSQNDLIDTVIKKAATA